jgi:hypothetical protein
VPVRSAQPQRQDLSVYAEGLQRYDQQMAEMFGPQTQTQPQVEPAAPGKSAQDIYYEQMLQRDALERQRQVDERAERQRQERQTASSFLRGILEQYNMGGLAGQVETLINDWGNNTAVIAERLRQTEEYKTRFRGLVQLQQRGITDIRNEAQYLELESEYRDIFRTAGLRDFLGQSGTQAEYDAIAKLVGDYSLSVNEVRARVSDAQRVAAQTPQEVRDALQRFYGVDASDLVSYSLDPTRTMTRINEKANAAILGGFATRAGLDVSVGAAERLVGGVGDQDIEIGSIQRELSEARQERDATRRLAEIEQSILLDEEVLESRAGTDIQAGQKIRDLKSRERARFGGTSGMSSRSLARRSGV